MLVNEAIETLRYEIDEECHCNYIADEIRLLISGYENLIKQEEKSHQYCKNVCEQKYKKEIERLKVYANTLLMSLELCKGWDKRAKAEAYKEFADMLNKSFALCYGLTVFDAATASRITDNLLKELVGEDNG